MRMRIQSLALILVACMLLAGCGGAKRRAHDEAFARKLLTCIYDGSLSPIKDSIHPYYRPQAPDWLTAAMGASLQARYGKVKGLTFVSSEERGQGDVVSVWRVAGERSSYEMKIGFGRSGKVIYLAFRPSPKDRWVPAVQMANEYIRLRMRKAGNH
jgi:hypothetical protein